MVSDKFMTNPPKEGMASFSEKTKPRYVRGFVRFVDQQQVNNPGSDRN